MNREEATKIVISALKKNAGAVQVSEEKMKESLVDLGVDSLEVMLLLMDVCETSGVEINDDEAELLDTPEKIVDFIMSYSQ